MSTVEAIFQNNEKAIDKGFLLLTKPAGSISYQKFFDESKKLPDKLLRLSPRTISFP